MRRPSPGVQVVMALVIPRTKVITTARIDCFCRALAKRPAFVFAISHILRYCLLIYTTYCGMIVLAKLIQIWYTMHVT